MGKPLIIGNHAYFAREGASIDSVTVAIDAKPDNDPTTNWTNVKLGCIESASLENNSNNITVRCPTEDKGDGSPGGAYQDKDEFTTQRSMAALFTLIDVNPLVWETIWMSGEITDAGGGTGTFTPLSAGSDIKGWLRLAQYDSNDNLVSAVEVWSKLTLEGNVNFNEEDVVKPVLRLKVFQNALNSGTLSQVF